MGVVDKNTAGQSIPVFAQDVSSQEGKTGYAESITVYVSKDYALAVESNATSTGTGNLTEIGGGFYAVPLTQSETNADVLIIFCDHTGTGDVAFDRLIIGTDSGTASVDSSAVADAVLDELLSEHTGTGSLGERIGRIPNIAAGSNGGLPTVDANNRIAGIQGSNWNTLDDVYSGVATTTEINAEVDAALRDIGLHKITSESIGTGTIADGSIIPALVDSSGGGSASWSNYDRTNHSLKAIRDRGDVAWITGTGGGGGDATEANQTTIIGHLTDVKGGGFSSATDSLEAIRDRGDSAWVTGTGSGGGSTAAQIWAHTPRTLTQTAAEATSVLSGSRVTIQRGDTLSLSLTDLGTITSYQKIWFTVKPLTGAGADSDSTLQVMDASGTGADGLLYVNGGTPTSSSNGSITVDDAADGDITITVAAAETAKLSTGTNFKYDVQVKKSDGSIQTLTSGGCTINADVTKASS